MKQKWNGIEHKRYFAQTCTQRHSKCLLLTLRCSLHFGLSVGNSSSKGTLKCIRLNLVPLGCCVRSFLSLTTKGAHHSVHCLSLVNPFSCWRNLGDVCVCLACGGREWGKIGVVERGVGTSEREREGRSRSI